MSLLSMFMRWRRIAEELASYVNLYGLCFADGLLIRQVDVDKLTRVIMRQLHAMAYC